MCHLDINNEGGGRKLLFIRKATFNKEIELTDFETLYEQVMINDCLVNFISSYKSHSSSPQIIKII